MHLPLGFVAGFAQCVDEALPILPIPKYRLAAVSPIHYVINCSGILHSELASHVSKNTQNPIYM